MSRRLDRAGIFKALPINWKVFNADSGAVAVAMELQIVAQLGQNGEWADWSEYEPHTCFGNWWVVKRDGSVNLSAVEQLAQCLGWSGDLSEVATGKVPATVVQINVEQDTYDDKVRFQARWMNPEDYVPSAAGASEDEVKQLQARFGSLLRAAASGAVAAEPAASTLPPPAEGPPPVTDEDIPF